MQNVSIIRDLLNCCLTLSTSICKRKSSYVKSGILFRSCGTYQLETWRPRGMAILCIRYMVTVLPKPCCLVYFATRISAYLLSSSVNNGGFPKGWCWYRTGVTGRTGDNSSSYISRGARRELVRLSPGEE